MEHQPQPCIQSIVDSREITSSYNNNSIDNSVDNRIDNSIRNYNYNTNTSICHRKEPATENQYSQKQEIFNWLGALSFANKHIDILNRHKVGTGQWFLEDDLFQRWFRGESRILLCQGIPGAGKSTLASIAINHLETKFGNDETVAIMYIYCNYKEQIQQTAASLINSLLWQIALSSKPAFDITQALHQKHKAKFSKPPQTECLQTLRAALLAFTRIFIFVDAVDEMVDSERNTLLKECKGLIEIKGVQLLILSRPTGQLAEYFEDSAQMELRAQDSDIMAYLDEQIQHRTELATLTKRDPNLQKKITTGITEKAQGMFLLARFHLEEVATANTRYELDKRLHDLPYGIDHTYASAFERILAQGATRANLAKAAILWITYCLRPLEIGELQHALAIKEEDMRLDEDSLIFPERILSACGGLVILDDKSRIVRLVHYTTQDYFAREGSKLLDQAPHATIAAACITYLSIGYDIYTRFWSNKSQYRFLRYAAAHWGHHARKASKLSPVLEKQIINFLRELELVIELWAVKKFWEKYIQWEGNDLDAPPGLVATIFGLYEIVKSLMERGPCHDLSEWWGDAVYYAVREGYEDVLNLLLEKAVNVKGVVSSQRALAKAIEMDRKNILLLLLEKGANTEVKVGWGGQTPLFTAVKAGHESIVQLLLERGAGVEARSWDGTPLFAAVKAGHESIVQLLLERGADVEATSWGGTPLFEAVKAGHEGIVRLLLEKGANTDVKTDQDKKSPLFDQDKKSPLFEAVKAGNEGIVRLLLEKGANTEVTISWDRQTPLFEAVKAGNEGIVRLLLEKNANTEVKAVWSSETPLFEAVRAGHESIVQLLLERGADVEARSSGDGTPLFEAAKAGHEGIIWLLLEKSTNTEVKARRDEKTPLLEAVKAGNEGIVQLLLEKNANTEVKAGWNNETPLFEAVRAGHESIVQLLLERDADVEARSFWGETPLFEAAKAGNEGIVRLLLEKGTNTEVKSRWVEETPLFEAAKAGHEGIVRLLLEKGTNTEVKSRWVEETPLFEAAKAGHGGIVQLLLEGGADVEARSLTGETPLFEAAKAGHEGIVRLLLEKGTNTEVKSRWVEETPLFKAAKAGHGAIVRLLLEGGADVEARCFRGETPLFTAVKAGHESIVQLLLGGVADVEARSFTGETPLFEAAKAGHESIVQLLLGGGADVEARSWDGTPLFEAAKAGHEGIVRLLLEKGANTKVKARWNEKTPLFEAVKAGNEGIVRLLLEKGANTELKDSWDRQTPLFTAVEAGNEGIVRLLLEKGANTEVKDCWDGRTPLFTAVKAGHGGIVRLLLEKGANTEVKACWDEKETQLFKAAEAGHEGIVRLLLDKGANMQHTASSVTCLRFPVELCATWKAKRLARIGNDWCETTCLHVAAIKGHTSVVRVLLEKGVSLQVSGGMLLSLAARFGRMRLVRVLLQKGVDVNTPVAGTVLDETAPGTHTALSSAIYGGHVGIVHLLLEQGADPNVGDVSPSEEIRPAVRDIIKDLLLAREFAAHGTVTESAGDGVDEGISTQSSHMLSILVSLGVFFVLWVIFLIS